MTNDCYSVNNNEKNDKLKMYKLIKPELDAYLLHNRLSNIKKYNIAHEHNTNNTNRTTNITNILNIYKNNENISFNNISNSNSNLSQLNQNNEKILFNKNIIKKLKKFHLPNLNKYSNAILFNNRKSKHFIFATRNKSELNMNKYTFKNYNYSIEKNTIKSYKIKNKFLTPEKRRINSNNNYNSNSNITFDRYKNNSSQIKQRINSAFLLPKIKSLILENNSSNKENEKAKIIINQNLNQLLNKIKKKNNPKKKVDLCSYKLPNLINKNKKDKINSCIHKFEYGNSKVFEKTHLDGLEENQKRKERKNKSLRQYEINEGYVDLNVLNIGDNISFKTNLISKDGIYFYEFNKNGKMETVEEKVHKVRKDKKEFKNLLERYKKNKKFNSIENKDFEINIKRNYGAEPIINKNIYKDLYHMLFKKIMK